MRNHRLALILVVVAGCVFGDVQTIEDGAPIEAVDRPGSFGAESGFGRILDGYRGQTTDGVAISRFVATAGTGSAHAVYGFWQGDAERSRKSLFDGCEDPTRCDASVGTDVIGIALWDGLRDCIMTSSVGTRRLRIHCESDASVLIQLAVPEANGFGTALARIPAESDAGVAVVGAPEAAMAAEAGELWKVVADDVTPKALVVDADSGIGPAAQLGAAVATAPMPGGDVMIVAAAPGADRVVAFRMANDPADLMLETLGCVDRARVRPPGAAVEVGGSIAAGDTDGDGLPELVVGLPGTNEVRVVRGSALGGAVGCASSGTDDDPASTSFACAALDAPSVETCGDFGAAVEVADVSGDGMGDLLIGAPGSTVGGAANAGALYTVPGGAGGLDAARGRGIGRAEASADALLGEALTTVPSQLEGATRAEAVVAAPGESRLYVFWCTGVPGDDAADGQDRCLAP